MGTAELSTFLSYARSQKTVSLIVSRFRKQTLMALEREGFVNLQNPQALGTSGKRYAYVTPENAKELYDLAAQYASGQIAFYDEEQRRTTWINPAYPGSALVLVADRDTLAGIEESGLSLLGITGLTFQTP